MIFKRTKVADIRYFIAMNVQYLTNEAGERTAVIISLKEWETIRKKLQEYQFKKRMKSVASDVKRFKEGKLKTRPLEDLLNEL